MIQTSGNRKGENEMRKKSCLLVVLALLLSLCSACGNQASSISESASEQKTAVSADASESQRPVENKTTSVEESTEVSAFTDEIPAQSSSIQYPVGNGETYTIALVADGELTGFLPEGDPANCSAIRKMQDVTGINLDYTVFAMLSDNMTLMLASGDWTDIIVRISETTSYTIPTALEEEIILDLAPYIDEYAPDYAAIIHSNEQFEKECYTEDGKMGEFNEFRQPTITGMSIRMDWLEEAGITTVPETYAELEEACLAVKENHPDIPGCIPMAGSLITECYETEFRYGYGFNDSFFNDENRNVQFAWTSNNGRAYLEMLTRWVDEGIVTKDEMLTEDVMNMRARVYIGQSLVQNGNSEMFSPSFMSMVEDANFALFPMGFPRVNAGDALRVNAPEVSVYAGWSLSTTCPDPELLISALNWLYTDEGTIYMNFGIEGESYVIDDDGNYKFTDLVLNNPDGIPLFFAVNVYTGLDTPYIGLPDRATAQMSTQAELDAVEYWSSLPANNDGVVRGTLTLAETEQITNFADINTYVQQEILKFIMGETELTDESWNKYVDTVKSMGIDDVVAVYQNAQDRYDAK